MRKTEQDPLLRFKAEADECLFENLHFDSRMKERVVKSLLSEPKQELDNSRFRFSRKSWAVSLTAAVAIASAIVFTIPMHQHNPVDLERSPDGAAAESTLSAGSDDPPLTTKNDPLPDSGVIHDPRLLNVWELESVEEAKAEFGDSLMTASYTPDSYKLDSIIATGNEMGTADQIILRYASGDRFFEVIQQRQPAPEEIEPGEELKVDIAGMEGFFTSVMTDNDPLSITVLQWLSDGIQYTLIGAFDQDEALQIARSLK